MLKVALDIDAVRHGDVELLAVQARAVLALMTPCVLGLGGRQALRVHPEVLMKPAVLEMRPVAGDVQLIRVPVNAPLLPLQLALVAVPAVPPQPAVAECGLAREQFDVRVQVEVV